MALLLCPELSFGQAGAGASSATASLFERLDRNKDGYLSREELASDEALKRNWIAVDRDRDGRISRTEFNLIGAAPPPAQPSAAAGETGPPKKE
jgi:Ca2+-binding EF-hand superfamily protein